MAAKGLFDREEFKPLRGVWDLRAQTFETRESYWNGKIYDENKWRFGWIIGQRLYRGIKPLHLPFARAVDVDAGIVPGRWKFPDDAPDAWRTARKQIFDWSGWATRGVLYVHYGAVYGQSVLKVADLRDARQVIVAPVNPRHVLLVPNGAYDTTPRMAIYIEKRKDGGGEFEYGEVITDDMIRTFRDGEPTGFEGRLEEYPNELKVVPYVEVKHIETGELVGACTFDKGMRILDELNQLSSYLSDIIKKHADPQYAISGADAGSLKKGDNVWFLPEGVKVDTILAQIDVEGVRGFLADLRENVNATLPELAFDALKEKAEIATATLELQLMELVLKIKRSRPNYDQGLVAALRMAGRAAKTMDDAAVAALDDETLSLDNDRPVLRAELDTREKVDYLMKSGAPAEAIWELLGVEQDVIDEWNAIKDRNAQRFNEQIDSDGEDQK